MFVKANLSRPKPSDVSQRKIKLEKLAMRFMVIVKADRNSEAGILPDERILTAMGYFGSTRVQTYEKRQR